MVSLPRFLVKVVGIPMSLTGALVKQETVKKMPGFLFRAFFFVIYIVTLC
jgi:hypothetical protein